MPRRRALRSSSSDALQRRRRRADRRLCQLLRIDDGLQRGPAKQESRCFKLLQYLKLEIESQFTFYDEILNQMFRMLRLARFTQIKFSLPTCSKNAMYHIIRKGTT